jgi:hypothetical protein
MKYAKRVTTVAASVLIAAATGHFMQSADTSGPSPAGTAARPIAASLGVTKITPIASVAGSDEMSRPIMTKARTTLAPLPKISVPTDMALPSVEFGTDQHQGGFASPCIVAPELTLAPAPDAFVTIDLNAPCAANTPFELRQGGIGFDAQTDDAGHWTGAVPALEPEARIDAIFDEGPRATAKVAVPGIASLNRVALSWRSEPTLGLHVFETGAPVGGAGHVFADATRSAGTSLGGYLTVLGDDLRPNARFAQIYSAPAGMTEIAFEFAAPVTDATCGTDFEATAQRSLGGRGEAPVDISIAMPECDAIGDVVLMPLPGLPLMVAARD